jgi:Flp pilus assembly protein TadD
VSESATIAHFQILKKLGAGGMGEVYLAHDTKLDRRVALKLLPPSATDDPQYRKRLMHEAKAAARLDHPNICAIHDVAEANDCAFIVMQYVEGETLAARMRRSPLNLNAVIDISRQVVEALEAAHGHGVIHRDIKPQNIMLTATGQVKVLDFGLAKVFAPSDIELTEAQTLTQSAEAGQLTGTIPYMSPEQATGKPLDHRTDLFSLGIIVYEMLTGQRPFSGGSAIEVLGAVIHKEPPPMTDFGKQVPEELIRIVEKMMEKDRELRYQSAHEVRTDLERMRHGTQTSGQRVAQIPMAAGKKAARRWLIVAAAGIAVMILLRAGLVLWPGRSGIVPAAEANGVVVLPCKVMGPGAKDAEYLSEALPASISILLGQVEGLQTKIPTLAGFESVKEDLVKIAALYKVNRLVLSTVTAESDQLVYNVQLVEPKSRSQLWGMQYEGQRKEYNRLAQSAAEGLRQALRPASAPVTSTSGLAATSEAELAYQKGRYFSNQYNNKHQQADFDRAFAEMKRALDLDPKLADAAAEIAFLFVFKAEFAGSAQEAILQIEFWAKRALQISDRCGLGWEALEAAALFGPHPDKRRMLDYALKAVYFAPQRAMIHMGLAFTTIINSDTLALEAAREAHRLDALYLYGTSNIAWELLVLGRSAEALPYVEEVLSIEPEHPHALSESVFILADLGRLAEAREALKKAQPLVAAESMFAPLLICGQYALALEQRHAQSAPILKSKVLAIVNRPQRGSLEISYIQDLLLPFLIRHGEQDLALRILSRGQDLDYMPPYDKLILHPGLDSLRRDARFKPILEKSRKNFEETLQVFQQARSQGYFPSYLEAPLADLLKKLGI